jgi:hypothetical protein
MECSLDGQCWVAVGGIDALQSGSIPSTPRCAACGGKLILEGWRTPGSMKLSAYGRLSYRGRARPQRPDNRGVPRKGEVLGTEGGDSFPLRAEAAS